VRIETDPLQDAIAAVMRILTVVLVVGVAAKKLWRIAGLMADWIVDLFTRSIDEDNEKGG